VVIVPSRGRPEAIRELAEAFSDTCTADTLLHVALDEDDPSLAEYGPLAGQIGPHRSMVEALNASATLVAGRLSDFSPFAVGFCGDDHRPRTKGWDAAYLEALRDMGTGIVYGDDLLQREKLPTQCAMTSDIVRALGYMAPPSLTHMYVDNFWLDLGRLAGCLRYLPDVVVEHMHPIAGKAEWDDGHRRVNAPAMYYRDRIAYARFREMGDLADAVAKVKALRDA
jgi:hypothetical protein